MVTNSLTGFENEIVIVLYIGCYEHFVEVANYKIETLGGGGGGGGYSI